MSKKKTATRRSKGDLAANVRKVPAKTKRRPAVVGKVDTLSIVEDDAGRALSLRDLLGMNRETFARLVSMSTRNLANVEGGKTPSDSVLRRLKELQRVIDALSEVIRKEAIGPWLNQPNEAFGGLKPLEVIERGEVDRIWQMIYYLRSGVAS
jgi:transcriptional regulator with XRE-family HTH domain